MIKINTTVFTIIFLSLLVISCKNKSPNNNFNDKNDTFQYNDRNDTVNSNDNNDTVNSNNKYIKTTYKDTEINGKYGILIDANIISGIQYKCNGETLLTDSKGIFSCNTFPIDFYLGNLHIGRIDDIKHNKNIFPAVLLNIYVGAAMHPLVTNFSLLVQYMDEDNNLNNGIQLNENAINAINEVFPEYKEFSEIIDGDIDNIILIYNKNNDLYKNITRHEAQINLIDALSKTPIR